MRYATILLILFSFFSILTYAQVEPAPPTELDSVCTEKTDEFTQKTTISCPVIEMKVQQQPSEMIYTARAMLQRVVQKKKGQTWLVFHTSSDSWNFLRTKQAYAIIGGENYQFKLFEVDSQTSDYGGVYEERAFRVKDDILKVIADTADFRMKVGRAVFQLPKESFARHASYLLNQ